MFHAASVGPILGQRVHFEHFAEERYLQHWASPTDLGDAGPDPQDPWRLTHRGIDRARAARDETLFALANGTLGVRGALEEGDSASDGSFLSSVFEQNPIHYHERFPGFTRSTDTRVPVAEGKAAQPGGGVSPVPSQTQTMPPRSTVV